MITRLLIANRGEIACRIIKTTKKLGITAIAVYSTADKSARHVALADEAYCIGKPDSKNCYLNQTTIIDVAKRVNVTAIHPGYGFLAENAEFATKCHENNIIFIGPSADVIELMGDKAKAKNHLANFDVPLVPGYSDDDQTESVLFAAAKAIGYPVLLKAACGGGGKGMRVVNQADEFSDNLARAQQEALASFSDDRIIIEKYIACPRHIEVQVFSDSHGNHVHLFERDCSIQRRHQKIIEEAPAPNISSTLRDKLTSAAITIAQSIHYQGAGTIEFLTDSDENCFFMEMNTRLQVEHPVTEMITGLDLVEWQIIVANGGILPLTQASISTSGHAIEVRLYAEDPSNQFLPSIGKLTACEFPNESDSVRVETGVTQNDVITQYYDPMIAKLVVHANSRAACINKLQNALNQCYLLGVKTNIQFLQQIIHHNAFFEAALSTHFLTKNTLESLDDIPTEQLLAWACCYFYLANLPPAFIGFENWRLNHVESIEYDLILNEQHTQCLLQPRKDVVDVKINDIAMRLIPHLNKSTLTIDDGIVQKTLHVIFDNGLHLWHQGQHHIITQQLLDTIGLETDCGEQRVSAPMPGTIVAIYVAPGEKVTKGDNLLVMEAMKMQHTLTAPRDGEIKTLYCETGEFVKESTELVELA